MQKTPKKAERAATKKATPPATAKTKPAPAKTRPATKAASASASKLAAKEVFARLQRHSLAKPGAVEEYPWGDVAWKVRGKLFAVTGQDAAGVTVKASLEDQAVLVQHPAIRIAAYVGRFGWVSIEIADEETLALACKLIDESYAGVAGGSSKQRATSAIPARRTRPSRPAAP